MKTFMKGLLAVMMIVGYIMIALAFVCGLGYGIYLLGVVELTFGKALWGGFVLWVKMFFGGLLTSLIGLFGAAFYK